MELNKKNIEELFEQTTLNGSNEKLLQNDSLLNVQIFGNEVILDFEISNPTLQYKKKIEGLSTQLLQKKFGEELKVKTNFSIKKVEKEVKIQGNPNCA